MQFAVNYSPQAADLLREGRIEVDRFKCPPWKDLLREASTLRPVYVHFDLVAGRGGLEKTDWSAVELALKETDTPFVNVHLASLVGDLPGITGSPLTDAQRQRVTEQMYDDVMQVVQRFGADRVIVENIPYLHAEDSILRRHLLPTCVEPEVLTAVIYEAGCGFLFDISHACISAETLEMDARTYIEALPLERIRELHVTGIELIDGRLEDHMPMTESDWQVFEWVMNMIAAGDAAQPWMVAFEYGGIGKLFDWRSQSDVMAAQVPRLYETVHGLRVRR